MSINKEKEINYAVCMNFGVMCIYAHDETLNSYI